MCLSHFAICMLHKGVLVKETIEFGLVCFICYNFSCALINICYYPLVVHNLSLIGNLCVNFRFLHVNCNHKQHDNILLAQVCIKVTIKTYNHEHPCCHEILFLRLPWSLQLTHTSCAIAKLYKLCKSCLPMPNESNIK